MPAAGGGALHVSTLLPVLHRHVFLPGGSDPLHGLQKQRQREKGTEGEKLATRGNWH